MPGPSTSPNVVREVGYACNLQPAISSLTDETAGTANGTVQALPNPADAPLTADILRDDLVANLLPALRNDLADLTATVNAILVALRAAGVIAS